MELTIFIRTLVLGPLFSAVTFVLSGFLASYASDSHTRLNLYEIFTAIIMVITAAYVMVFIPAFGFMPGIIPLFIYSFLLAIFTRPFFHRMSEYGLKNRTKVFFTTILSIIIGATIYCGFYLLTSPHGNAEHLGLFLLIVVPTSAIFGAWSGLSYVRERS